MDNAQTLIRLISKKDGHQIRANLHQSHLLSLVWTNFFMNRHAQILLRSTIKICHVY